MVSLVTEGIRISVLTLFEKDYSRPNLSEYIFSYTISIENTNPFEVQLLRRKWVIVDANGDRKEIEGVGIVGLRPFIAPGQTYTYSSTCDLRTEIGMMKGMYYMRNIENDSNIQVLVPSFQLIAPYKMN
ncbi:MAG: Co2+/Mg2+ efflux protein ApaG [Bacteroidota bacterium]